METRLYLPPKTPPRRGIRGSTLAPTSFVTPSKNATPSHHRLLRSSPVTTGGRLRLDGTPPRSSSKRPYWTQAPPNSAQSTTQNGDDDRFIPSRRYTNLSLVRKALLSGDKNQTKKRPHSEPEGPAPAVAAPENPLQKEFKRRMLSSLCNIPLEKLDEDAQLTGLLTFGDANTHVSNKRASSTSPPHKTPSQRPENPFSHDLLRSIKLGRVTDEDQTEDDAAAMDRTVQNKILRKVPSAPFRILDAPDIVDDYYLNLISWGKDNVLAVALAQSVYLWNAGNGDISNLVTLENENNQDYVTSVSWCTMQGHTKYIGVGTNNHAVMLYDASTMQKIRTLPGHHGRVSAMAWNQDWLTSGSRDSKILNHDIRSPHSIAARYSGHLQEVCGMKWNEDGSCLASGGNENYLCLWDAAMSGGTGSTGAARSARRQLTDTAPRLTLRKHRAAVKALDWCPFYRGLLASGGGTSDRTIKFWNTSSGALLNSVDTGSQVCSLIWNKNQRELCSSHGYSENQLILWKYPTMTRIKELQGHTARVLNMEMSPDGSSVVSAAADETLRFWNIFGSQSVFRKAGAAASGIPELTFGQPAIR
ncbi:hypothetical protein MPSEU_000779300 [Mayamaea pseudoterrestris]|nr:hypothetical protein MPSEU_000779300 [Mayamaea pseudoterrestris]